MTILAPETHILIFPFPAQGHMIPLLDLTHKLAIHGLTITVLVTPKNLSFLIPLLSNHPSIKTLVFPFPPHPSIPTGVENNKDLPGEGTPILMRTLGQLYNPLLYWFKSHPSPPVAIISDMFLGWTQHLATQLNIKRLLFSPSGAMALSVIYSLWSDMPKRDQNEVICSFSKIPNSPKFPWWQISPIYRSYVENDPDWEFIKDSFCANLVSWGLIVNSFTELEGMYLDYLKKELSHDNLWAVGPLHPPHHNSITRQTERGGPSSVPVQDVMTWLDTCEDHKVVFISFGSQTSLTNDQMKVVASSLEISKVYFIWCVKEDKYNMIPSGFEDRVAGRGFVIRGWAPQVLILSHPAVGAFLTHCGWNSVLEALTASVPMLAWPMGADQFVNANLLVDELEVAVRVCEGAKTLPDSAELARVLKDSVSEILVDRERAKKLNRGAHDSGSSVKDFDCLVKQLFRSK